MSDMPPLLSAGFGNVVGQAVAEKGGKRGFSSAALHAAEEAVKDDPREPGTRRTGGVGSECRPSAAVSVGGGESTGEDQTR